MIARYIKDTLGNDINDSILLDAVLGYLGISAYHSHSFMQVKSSKNHQLV
jgi:hypothetical protein